MPIALKRQEILHEKLTPEEVVELNALLVKMLDSAGAMQSYENEILAEDSVGKTPSSRGTLSRSGSNAVSGR